MSDLDQRLLGAAGRIRATGADLKSVYDAIVAQLPGVTEAELAAAEVVARSSVPPPIVTQVGTAGAVLLATANVADYIMAGVFTRDFWARGQMGAQKGASVALWDNAWVVYSRMGCPNIESFVAVPGAVNFNDTKRAWDLGWMPMPPGEGQPVDPLWAHLYDNRSK